MTFSLPFSRGFAIALLALATTCFAQESPRTPVLPEYLVELQTPEGCFFSPVVSRANRGFLVYALARPARYLPDSSGHPILSKISVQVEGNNELWKVNVAIGAGEFYDAGDQQLGAFTLRTNERANVGEAARFGLGSFGVGVVKVVRKDARKPRITFKTRSISVNKVEVEALPAPYKISLKNDSDKDVLAIQYNTYKNGQMIHLRWLAPPSPELLIKAGQEYTLRVLSEDRTCADADGYHPAQTDRIEIAAVVFADGSYEGDTGLAALIKGQAIGNKNALDRVVSELSTFDAMEQPELLLSQMKALSEGIADVAEPTLLAALLMGLPPQSDDAGPGLTNFIRAGQHGVRTSLLWDAQRLEQLIKTQNREAISKWSVKTIAKYKQWQALADAVSSH